jgi:hypothetical protein
MKSIGGPGRVDKLLYGFSELECEGKMANYLISSFGTQI